MLTHVGDAILRIDRCDPGAYPSLHTQLGTGEYPFGTARFLQHINGLYFWLSLERPDGERVLYQLSAEQLMNAVLNKVAEIEAANGGDDA